jgi:hypothetical protein
MVVLTVVGGAMSMLLLAPPPGSAWGDDVAGASQPVSSDLVNSRWIRPTFALPSSGSRPSPSPVQTGTSARTFAQLLAQASVAAPPPSMTRTERARLETQRVTGGPVLEMTLDTSMTMDSPASRLAAEEQRGDDAVVPAGGPRRLPPARLPPPNVAPAAQLLMPQLSEMAPIEIVVMRNRAQTERADLSSQGHDDDPLPEFRRFLPRAEACVTEAARRARQPLQGKVVLRFTVEKSGWVKDPRAVGGTLADVEARACMEQGLTKERYFSARAAAVEAERAVIVR